MQSLIECESASGDESGNSDGDNNCSLRKYSDHYEIISELGKGTFGTVYKAKHRIAKVNVAIKITEIGKNYGECCDKNGNCSNMELEILKEICHPNITKMYESIIRNNEIWEVMELCEYGSCRDILNSKFKEGFKDEIFIATVLKYILTAVDFCHSKNIIHRDIKCGNVLIDDHGCVKLCDFGTANQFNRCEKRTTLIGSPCWMAPEVICSCEKGYNEKIDIWSIGITALELAMGKTPFDRLPPMKIMLLLAEEKIPKYDEIMNNNNFSSKYKSFIRKCLRFDVEKRYSARQLMEHKFIKLAQDETYILNYLKK
jgi:serine/threonine-protein kinase OSR1/STK39